MRFLAFFSGAIPVSFTAAALVPGWVPATMTPNVPLVARQAASLTSMPLPESTTTRWRQPEDPWQCATENITQYYLGPSPTGDVGDAINTFGEAFVGPCVATATGLDALRCAVQDYRSWCGFSTAVPANVQSSYSTYVSSVVSFWEANSATMAILSTSCSVSWALQHDGQRNILYMGSCHARCYLEAHTQTTTTATSSGSLVSASLTSSGSLATTPTSSITNSAGAPTTTSSVSLSSTLQPLGRDLEALALVGTGLALLANTV
jgi:hypothetical protein